MERKARRRMAEEEHEMKLFNIKERENEKMACKYMAKLEQEMVTLGYRKENAKEKPVNLWPN